MTTEDLGEKSIEGIAAVGVRTTTVVPAGHAGNDKPIATIHEVWTSTEMKLVVKVIDGDPRGEETVRGLEYVSLSPNAALFRPPDDYGIQHPEGSVASEFAEADMADYAEWFVK